MKQRDFVPLGWATMIATGSGKLRPAFGMSPGLQQVAGPPQHLMARRHPAGWPEATCLMPITVDGAKGHFCGWSAL
jgi:hypothetical protein